MFEPQLQTPLLLAVGVVTAPEFTQRRMALRGSWLRWPNVGPGRAVVVRFVLRSSGAPMWLDERMREEQRAYGDLLRVEVQWNETRLKGPTLSLAKWLDHAVVTYSSAHFIAKMDDDAYCHVPRLEALLRTTLHQIARTDRVYMGSLSWFNWFPRVFERSGYGWGYTMAYRNGLYCKNLTLAEARCGGRGCGQCVGPFPFVSGYLVILSAALALELQQSPTMADDVTRLHAAPQTALVSRTGEPQIKVMEDIWLGSVLERHQLLRGRAALPVSFVALSEGDDRSFVSDEWGLRVTRSAIVVHIRGKQLERFVAVHEFMEGSHCAVQLRLTCAPGCPAFLTSRERHSAELNPSFRKVWVGRLNRSGFCGSATQGHTHLCRIRKPGELLRDGEVLPRCCQGDACVKPANLMKAAYAPRNLRRSGQLANLTLSGANAQWLRASG